MAHRFFVPRDWIRPPLVYLEGEIARQIKTVLRMQPGDEIVVLDNSGSEWRVALTEISGHAVNGEILAVQPGRGEPSLHLSLYQGTLKAQKFEWVLQKGTEIGISRFIPTICHRSILHAQDDLARKSSRWERIIREAAEQSGRGRLPLLEPAMTLAAALRDAAFYHPLLILAWEEAVGPALKDILSQPYAGIALFIGPEGGFTRSEAALAHEAGARLVKLGPRILRAETAGLAASSAILYAAGEWN